jgi:hypothetical protein
MKVIENDVEIIGATVTRILAGSTFEKFCYSGIYTMVFSTNNTNGSTDIYKIDIGTSLNIYKEPEKGKSFIVDDFLLIWGKKITRTNLATDLSLTIFFENSVGCKISAELYNPEGLFDMRWTLYQCDAEKSLSIWVSDEQNIYYRDLKG